MVMAKKMKKVKFALEMANDEKVRDLESFKEYFDIEKVVGYFHDGRLLTWLKDRYYDDEADKVAQLSKDDSQLQKKLCDIFGIEYEDDETDPEEIARRQERLKRLKQYTDDKKIFNDVDLVAFDQEELGDLLDEDQPIIYLCHNTFTIPLRVTDKTYIGIGKAVALIRSDKIVDFDALNIKFQNVSFDDKYSAVLKANDVLEEKKRAEKNAALPKQLYDEGIDAENDGDYDTAINKMKESANLGYVKAFVWLGDAYNYDIYGVDSDIDEARKWYKKGMEKDYSAAFQGYARTFYDEGDYREAFKNYKKAAELFNDAEDENIRIWSDLGDMYREGKGTEQNRRKAVECYEKGAELGDERSCCYLGEMYRRGDYVEQDSYRAFELMEKAANAGNSYAMYELAEMYYYGEGTEEDEYEAFDWYKKAAEYGYSDAMYKLGDMYYNGEGTEEDEYEAFDWYKKAAENGNSDAMYKLGDMYYNGRGTDQDYYESFYWYKQAADNGRSDAKWDIAWQYRKGLGTSKDIDMAVALYTDRARNGNVKAMNTLGKMYRSGNEVQKDYHKAMSYFEQAADNGDGDAMNQIAMMYDYGQGVAQNYETAFQWIKRSAETGNDSGMSNLSLYYLWGRGVAKDLNKAEYWMNKAAEAGNYDAMLRFANTIYSQNHHNPIIDKLYERVANESTNNSYAGEAAYRLSYRYSRFEASNREEKEAYWTNKYKELGYTPTQEVIDHVKNPGNTDCYITTAVCNSFGKPDDCYELTAFRDFRDNWLAAQSDGYSLINEYYLVAPRIVQKIDELADAEKIYNGIWEKYLAPCLKFIESGDNISCKNKYVEMVNYMKEKFL